MKYEKPNIVVLDPAIEAIQGDKNDSEIPDSPTFLSNTAYQADE
jgi:hypothetical protein